MGLDSLVTSYLVLTKLSSQAVLSNKGRLLNNKKSNVSFLIVKRLSAKTENLLSVTHASLMTLQTPATLY